MRILVLGTPREDTAGGSIARALSLIHEVSMFDYERGFTPFQEKLYRLNALFHLAIRATRRQMSYFSDQRLLNWITGRRFDLIVIVAINMVPPDVVRALCART